ncbi:glutaredoxin family protein [Marinicellulosiphila megalodicopiae]|uniref:glutaredoxin family protein n=1 Tax=Marinicellulosiphila megalodicopiae TaxID=2724896 RepID=UPI003BAEC493
MLLMRKSAGACSLFVEKICVKFLFKPVNRTLPEQKKMDEKARQFVLYELKHCPDCSKLRRKLHQNQINIDTRNAQKYQCYRNEMLKGGGKIQFPCLMVQNPDNTQKWIYGGEAIYNCLQQQLLEVA